MTRKEQIEQAVQEAFLKSGIDKESFRQGIEWADTHPKDNPLEGILIHGNNDAYRLGYKKAIEKACELMEGLFWSSKPLYQLIEDFKRAMEE